MTRTSRFLTLRDYVNAQPRTQTQNMIAAHLGISASDLSRYLRGAHPSPQRAKRLSKLTGVSVESLLGLCEAGCAR